MIGRMSRIAIRILTVAVVTAFDMSSVVHAQQPSTQAPASVGERLMAEPSVKAALDAVRQNEPKIVEKQIRLCEIPAPPFKEQKRAEAYKAAFEALGLKNVRIDAVGNVLGERPGQSARPHVVFSAHLDTVFPEGTNVKTTRSGNRIKGPGIADDCRGLAVLIGVIRAMNEGNLQTPGSITFVGTVGEEGLGDLRGVKHLFNQELKGRIDTFVSVDGAGFGITHTAVGSRRYRVTFKGPGGHSYSAFGIANPIHALGRAIAKIAELQVRPPQDDLQRRPDRRRHVRELDCLRGLDGSRSSVLRQGGAHGARCRISQERGRGSCRGKRPWRNQGRLTVDKKLVGDRPGGSVGAEAPRLSRRFRFHARWGSRRRSTRDRPTRMSRSAWACLR